VKTSAAIALITGGILATLLSGCANRSTPAPVVERSPSTLAQPRPPVAQVAPVPGSTAVTGSPSPSGVYQVKPRDTLYSIALDHGVDPRELAQWNNVENGRIQPGQVLRVKPPEGAPPVQVGAARSGAGPIESRPLDSRTPDSRGIDTRAAPSAPSAAMKTEPKALRLPYSGENLALLQRGDAAQAPAQSAKPDAAPPVAAIAPKPPAPTSPAAPAAEPRDDEAIEFIWPAKGKVLARFSEPTSKGLDIAGKPGDPVVAAAGGRVIYIGTGIRGYGKLIVIKHDNNFNSVYAHNREILVKQDQTVTRGQKIAELGDTDSDSPKLHFEIRKSGKPVDPAKYLPPS
jgi:lipoprotein NlpD